MMKIPEEISTSIRDAENIVLFTHVHPDGDAVGSLLGCAGILKSLGKEVFCYLDEPVPYLYRFLPGGEMVSNSLTGLSSFTAGKKKVTAISLDCGDSDRLGKNKDIFLRIQPFLVIDHHRSHKEFGSHRWVDPDRSSTGEMVYELARHLQADISYDSAYNLYVAISTDTGSFRYDSTTSRTLRIAADLMDMGVSPDEISEYIHNNFTLERIRLLQMVLGTLSLHASGRLAVIHVTEKMFENSGALPEDVEGFVDFPRSITSVKIAAFVKEGKADSISVSLRSKGEYDVAEIAKTFGGGGHRNAAGFRFSGRSADLVHQIVTEKLTQVFEPSS